MTEKVKDVDLIPLEVSSRELRYLVSCGLALIQNIPEDSLPTYCGLSKDEIVDISMRLRDIADKVGVNM